MQWCLVVNVLFSFYLIISTRAIELNIINNSANDDYEVESNSQNSELLLFCFFYCNLLQFNF